MLYTHFELLIETYHVQGTITCITNSCCPWETTPSCGSKTYINKRSLKVEVIKYSSKAYCITAVPSRTGREDLGHLGSILEVIPGNKMRRSETCMGKEEKSI